MSDLKPCPFCDSVADLLLGAHDFDGAEVQCQSCGASSGHFENDPKGKAAAQHWNRRAQPAQAGPLLTDDFIKEAALEAFGCHWDADDETLVNKYGHGVYLWRFIDFARATEAAVRAKMGVAVPMTDAQVDKAMQAMFYPARNRAFVDGVRAAEHHHGIVGKEGA